MKQDYSPLSILKDLIQIPSQNPMGQEVSGVGWLESEMSQWLCEFFERINVLYEYHEIESDRGNVVARIEGCPSKPVILLDAHQDTVPAGGMTIDPFVPVESDGRLFGRGSSDVKGAMASILATVASIVGSSEPSTRYPTIIVSCSCDEERGQKGAKDLASKICLSEELRSPVLIQKPDFVIVSEPTDLNVVVAHKGTVRWKALTDGLACHSSDPSGGKNAIYEMGRVLDALERYATQLSEEGRDHALCGRPTLSVGRIAGGQSVNIVPDCCTIEIDRRVVPGEQIDEVIQNAERYVRDNTDAAFRFLSPDTTCVPLTDENNRELAKQLSHSTGEITGSSRIIGVPFATHAPRFANLDIPTVVFGPGSISQAHTEDEWIEIWQLDLAHRSMLSFLRSVESNAENRTGAK